MTWRTVDGFAAGTSHRQSNLPCQDRCRIATIGDAIVVAVLADGAGSASESERGAELVCAALVDAAARDLPSDAALDAVDDATVHAWFAHARERIAAAAEATGHEVRAYAATALLCVAGADATICAQVGDGGIVVRPHDEPFAVAIWPANGEYANQTFFITDDDASERCEIVRFGRVDDVVVLSDGLTRLALDHAARAPFAPFFEPLVRTVREASDLARLRDDLAAYLDSDAINARTDDDKAIAIATRDRTPRSPTG